MSSSIPESSARTRSDSTENSELPVHEHKRPRLSDTKADESDVMSDLHQEPSNSALAVPEIKVPAAKHAGEGVLPKTPPLPPRTVASPSAISPTSKVTINTRPLSSQSITQPVVSVEDTGMPSHSFAAEDLALCGDTAKDPEPVPISNPIAADIPETISISSSPSKSPEIEVAEPEDFDQDPNETRWTQRYGGTNNSRSSSHTVPPGHVQRGFPYSQEAAPGNVHRVLPRLKDRLQNAGSPDGQIFRQLKDWMADYVVLCDKFSSRLLNEEKEFWLQLPNVLEGLLRREAGPPPGARTEELVDFFVAFAQIAKLLIDFDAQNLRDVAEESESCQLKSFSLVSGSYLQALVWILQPRVPFFECLAKAHSLDRAQFHTLVIDRLADPTIVALLPSLSALLTNLSAVLPKRPDFFQPFHTLLQVTKGMMAPMTSLYPSDLNMTLALFSQLDIIRNSTAEIVLQADDTLQHAITKQLAWLNLETAKMIIETLNPMVSAIGEEIPQVGQDIISSAGVGFADSDLTDLPATMPYAWKFKILRKFITNGRMELRVYGVEGMSSDLVTVHRAHIDGQSYPPMMNPLVRYLTKFIKENQLIEYIVGVDSHPQLIQRAYNVVGFLCVSKSYTDAETDVIWRTIINSQDPRTVQEVFQLLRNCFIVYDLSELYYIGRKLAEYPFQRFDLPVLHFTGSLFESIRNRSGSLMLQAGFVIDPIAWRLCIRLLREASMEENASFEQAPLIRRDFPQHLSNLLSHGRPDLHLGMSGEAGWNQIIADAATNLKVHNKNASGDAQVLHCLLVLLGRVGAALMAQKFDLLGLLVADFAHLRDQFESMLERHVMIQSIEAMYEVRSTCLAYFILHMPEYFTADLVQELWTSFYAFSRLPAPIQATAWEKLSHAAKIRQSKDENVLLDLIIEKHLPTLAPHDYNQPVLEFIRTSVQYTMRRTPQDPLDQGGVIEVPGIERMWKVMLEAPPNTVENEATDFIIRMYLDNIFVTKRLKSVINATHSSLVDRSVQQVMASASKLKSYTDGTMSGEDEPMVIIASEDEIRAEELRFDRSLLFLRKFLEGMKQRPRYSPAPDQQAQVLPEFPAKRGETLDLNIQVMASKYVAEKMQKVAVGSENTCDELHKYLCEASGFTQFSIFHMGQKVSLSGQLTTIGESKVGPAGSLIVHKTLNTPDSPPVRSARANSPVDDKIMHHFDDLYDLLEADERLSREVYTFLSLFSAQTELVRIVRSRSRSSTELLPPGKPFKLLYCARALRSCIEDESFSSNPDTDFLIYSICTIVEVLPKLELNNSNDQLQMSIAHSLMEALLLAFRAKVSVETSREYVQDHQEFATQASRLLRFALAGQSSNPDDVSVSAMVKLVLEAFIEACLHDERIWICVDSKLDFQDLIVTAFVLDPRVEVRHSLLEVVVGLTGAIGTKLYLKINNPRAPRSRFPSATIETSLSHLWTALSDILPRACSQFERCAEVCETMLAIMRRVGKSFSIETLQGYFNQWSAILLKHDHVEVVGQLLKDNAILSLTKLLLESCKLLKAAHALPSGAHIIDRLISSFLFPPFSDDGDSVLPILDSVVREGLYNLILVLCQGPRDLATVVTNLKDDLLPGNFFESHYSHERQSLRTDVGYAGLKNLSNTCYLNSLFSQLFMNVQFREMFLKVLGGHGPKPRLVVELAKVFANMQNSYDKAIDPSSAVEAITTYEGEQIDVSVQMDVDEFFNLLFDRIEGQIDPVARDTFKSMYGGQLVQQVKSKECEHISERLEPFSAVQVEIKGKARLEDSLRAYVEGEVLQGENKYSCTSCGRHVDAVKRACLKDVPDNLIFNLKRFDYDILTGMRTKVNDEFQFPDTLDIAPYTLANLGEEQQTGDPDFFQLTGVIVHSGTADSGHYYSFIRQRPSTKNVQDSWVGFNDQDVSVFDPNQMRDQCFGGMSENGFYHLPKFYSAYMLFYQRTSSIQQFEEQYCTHDAVNPVRIPLTPLMDQHIAQENELFLRSYCAQDPAHAQFVLRLLEQMRRGVEACSDDHTLESTTIEMVLDYLHTVTSRFKELPSVEETITVLLTYATQCSGCARAIGHWFGTNRAIENVIVRSPLQMVRKAFARLLIGVFRRLRDLTDQDPVDDEQESLVTEYSEWLKSCLGQMSRLWDIVTKLGRCWIDYFDTLFEIHKLGDNETIWILEEDFLEKFVDMIMMHVTNPEFPLSRKLKTKYAQYLAARDRNRQFNYQALIRVFAALLRKIDLHLPAEEGYRRLDKKIGLNADELQVLGLHKLPPDLEWLRRLIIGRQSPVAVDIISTIFAEDKRLSYYFANLLTHGLNDRSVNIASTFTRPTVIFCQHCPIDAKVIDLARSALESIATVGLEYGKEYFEFADQLRKSENESCSLPSGFMEKLMLGTIAQWAPTLLMAPTEGQFNTRVYAVDLLKDILFAPLQEAEVNDSGDSRALRAAVQDLATSCSNFVRESFLNPRSREGANMQPGQVIQVIDVVEHSMRYFDLENAAEEEKVATMQAVVAQLRAKAESAVETLSSADWQDNSSELAELSGEEYEDALSP